MTTSAQASTPVIVVDDPEAFPPHPGLRVVQVQDFLAGGVELAPGARVVNLVPDLGYLSNAWYVSLLAEARGGVPLPACGDFSATGDLRTRDRHLRECGVDVLDADEVSARMRILATSGRPAPTGVPPVVDDEDEPDPRAPTADEQQRVWILAGRSTPDPGRMARKIFQAWPMPIMEVGLVRDAGRWRLFDLQPRALSDLDEERRNLLADALAALPRSAAPSTAEASTPSLAILWDGADAACASTVETMDRLARVAARRGLRVERLGPADLGRLGDHDALFIRTLTGVDQPAWRFATRAEALGMPVIDHPTAIVRCGSKVYLHELLSRAGLATPRTVIFGRELGWDALVERLGAPVVVKVPDGSFSAAVFKITNAEDFAERVPPLLDRSPLLVAQEYLPTDFDWRIGVLDGRVLWAAKYHMVPGHWQIRALRGGSVRYGRVEAVPRDKAPKAINRLATRAAALLGDGLFGVDLKDGPAGAVVIEVNDNPNLDIGYEDVVEGDWIYEELVRWFQKRLRTDRPAPRARPAMRDRELSELRKPIGRLPPEHTRPYKAWEVLGMELEYAIVDRDLNIAPLVEDALAALGGRPCSDVELGRVGFSNEIVDHVLEVKNLVPHRHLAKAEDELVAGVQRMSILLAARHDARLLPGGMHPWFRPAKAQLWRRSNRRIYDTYARLFDVHTHGWANVQAVHVNLPMGTHAEATTMMNAARLLVPYLPALAASSPLVEGELTGSADNRVTWLLKHQARLPESMARLVPEPLKRYSDYRRDILGPMYAAVDRLPEAEALRHEFLNARGAVFKASRDSMEVRILDVQECVKVDVALACFTRRALRDLVGRLDELPTVSQELLEADLLEVARLGSRARVWAPHLVPDGLRDADGRAEVRVALRQLVERVDRRVSAEEQPYIDLVARIVAYGSLSEGILRVLQPLVHDEEAFTDAARRTWIELADCLVENRPWPGRFTATEDRGA